MLPRMSEQKTNNVLSCTARANGKIKRTPVIMETDTHTTTADEKQRAYESVQATSYGLAVQDVLNVADGARRLNRRAWENRQSLLGRVQHLLHVRQDAADVGPDQRALENIRQLRWGIFMDECPLTLLSSTVEARRSHHSVTLKESSAGDVSEMVAAS